MTSSPALKGGVSYKGSLVVGGFRTQDQDRTPRGSSVGDPTRRSVSCGRIRPAPIHGEEDLADVVSLRETRSGPSIVPFDGMRSQQSSLPTDVSPIDVPSFQSGCVIEPSKRDMSLTVEDDIHHMATETTETTPVIGLGNVDSTQWLAGAAGGFLGSVLFGLMMQYVMPPPLLEMAIPAMYGIEGPALAAGWALHQFHGVVLGLAYVALVQFGPLRAPARRFGGSLALGVVYGVLTTIGLAVIVMPLWLQTMGFPGAPPFPNVAIPGTILGLVGHIIYAIPVAIAYALVTEDRE